MIKAVMFDLDNTLIDFMRIKSASVEAAVNAMVGAGLPLNKEEATKKLYEVYWKTGIEYQRIFQKFLREVTGKIDYRILAMGIVAYRNQQNQIIGPYPQVLPTLLKLKERGLKLAIVTDAPRLKAWIRMTEIKLQDFFDVVVTFEDTGKHKPDPAPFRLALKRLGLKPTECLMVGDWPEKDIKGAKSLGIKTAFAKYGALKPATVTADYNLKSIEDVLKITEE